MSSKTLQNQMKAQRAEAIDTLEDLRDEFAKHAITAAVGWRIRHADGTQETLGEAAYRIADDMIAERAKRRAIARGEAA